MSLVTRCPGCATAFRVQPAQLSARGGQVRCGRCHEVFNGIAALVGERPEHLVLEPSPQLGLFDPSRRAEAVRRPAPRPKPPAVEEPLPEFLLDEAPPPRNALWGSLAFLAMLTLVAQAGFHFRSELAMAWPALRAPLAAACQPMGCDLPLPRELHLLAIDSYEVRADPQRQDVIVLNAVIRNRAPFPQAFPALQFALTDDASRPVSSRVLSPRDYLDAEARQRLIERGIAANGEAPLTVYFDTDGARATGYRLELFYPS